MAAVVAGCVCAAAPAQAQAAGDSRAAAPSAAAPAASDDIQALGKQVQVILAEARRQQAMLAEQRLRLASAEATNAWLTLGLLAMAVLCAVLGLRLWRAQRPVDTAAAPPVPGPAARPPAGAVVTASTGVTPPVPERPLLSPAADVLAAAQAPTTSISARTLTPLVRGGDRGLAAHDLGFGTGVPPRPVSVEELLDLDQQVDFFLALGQAQSAIDLLLGHVRSTGGTNALPYFKLLDIYREQGDEEAYERTRERFNQRFNANAPDWSGSLAGGRQLEDYPEVVLRLQRAWAQPIRAVAELEGLLLRRADLEPFDLPAYHDVLMLHAMVRDLPASPVAPPPASVAVPVTTPAVLAREQPPPSPPPPPPPRLAPEQRLAQPLLVIEEVDLLLPLGEHPMDTTMPRPHLADRPAAQSMLADWVFTRASSGRSAGGGQPGEPEHSSRPMKLDLDLSDYAPAPREFTRPAAFTDIDMLRDRRLSDLGGLDERDPVPSRR